MGNGSGRKRDYRALTGLIKYQRKIKELLVDFDCDLSQNEKSICNNKYAFDLCAFYMSQIGESVKTLGVSSRAELDKVVDIRTLIYFRNAIDCHYRRLNIPYFLAHVAKVIEPEVCEVAEKRLSYHHYNEDHLR